MPNRGHSAVIVAGHIIGTAHHGLYRAVAINGHQCTLSAFRHIIDDCLGCRALHFQVERGPYIDGFLCLVDQAIKLRQYPVGEITDTILWRFGCNLDLGRLHRRGLFGRDHAGILHHFNHHARTVERCLCIRGRRIARGRFHKPCDNGGFGQRKIFCAMVEEFAARGINTIGATTEIDLVQIKLEYLLLGKLRFHRQCENNLADFPAEFLIIIQIDVAGKLLRDGGPALRPAPFNCAHVKGAGNADRVDARMHIIAAVLNSDHRFFHLGREL